MRNATIIKIMLWTLIVIIGMAIMCLSFIFENHQFAVGVIYGAYWIHMIRWMRSFKINQN